MAQPVIDPENYVPSTHMDGAPFRRFDLSKVRTPVHICDEVALRRNMEILQRVQRESGAKIILALKAFAQWSVFPIIREYLAGTTASSLDEALLGRKEFGGEVHATAPAYPPEDFAELADAADHIVFNSFHQWRQFRPIVEARRAQGRELECGIRINPEHRETEVELYDPCAPGSRLGVRARDFAGQSLDGISGLHFHTLCQAGFPQLKRTLAAVEERFGRYFPELRWINFGGGHHITQPDYDVAGLIELIRDFRARTGLAVYMEPGEASAVNTGVLVSRVLDIVGDSPATAILDTSATAHMPDTLEMPYRAEILDAKLPGVLPYTYRLGGLTCLAGDVIGDYSFAAPLKAGDLIYLLDMSHYTMVKNTHFNGVRPPAIAVGNTDSGALRVVREFRYEDYRNRLS